MDLLEPFRDGDGQGEEPPDLERPAEQPLERDAGEVLADEGGHPLVHDQHERPQDARLLEIAGDLELVPQAVELPRLVRLGAQHLEHDTPVIRTAERTVQQRVLIVAERLDNLETRLVHH